MIENIIKRSGQLEKFNADKVNKWGQWAAETLGDSVDWSHIVMRATAGAQTEISSQELQERLIRLCLEEETWSYYLMAGRLYAPYLYKHILKRDQDNLPTVKEVHRLLETVGLMRTLKYSDEEYAEIEKHINHRLDFEEPHFALHQIRTKYALRNRISGQEYETPQYVYMRMAMALAEDEAPDVRMEHLLNWYELFSEKSLSAPTPNYVNLGTHLAGYASCCIYSTNDSIGSLAAGDHIAYMMTAMSAGIGAHINTRSLGDPVRGGAIEHQGRGPYLRALEAMIKANLQNGRGGAATDYYEFFNPDLPTIARYKNPMSTEDRKIRGIDYAMQSNKFLARLAKNREQMFTFNSFTAPDLYEAFYSADVDRFERLYRAYEADESFEKHYVDAREALLIPLNEAIETGRHYLMWVDEMNRHTPHKDTIRSSNLCTETGFPSAPYDSVADLYTTEDHGRGEIGLCSLGAVVISKIRDRAHHKKVVYYALRMIDKCIHQAEYTLPHLSMTAKARMNAGVGMMGLAHHLARKGLRYTSDEGKQEIHRIAERHMYLTIEASLELGQEFGNAPWMHKTKWPEGWMPVDTYCRNVDTITDFTNEEDWEDLRSRVVANKGIRNSSLVNYMPGESSSKAVGETNSIYAVRRRVLVKSDDNVTLRWAAPHGDNPDYLYESAWDIPMMDMIQVYGIVQKWTDQSISADYYRTIKGNDRVKSSDLLNEYFAKTFYGHKTSYYSNSATSKGRSVNEPMTDAKPQPSVDPQPTGIERFLTPTTQTRVEQDDEFVENVGFANCGSGGCAL